MLPRLLSEEGKTDYSWDSENVGIAVGVSIGAGLATGIGGLVVFVPQVLSSVPKATILSVALAISGGVMLYVSFVEIFVKAQESIATKYENDGQASGVTTACFFFGMFICVVLEVIVHRMHRKFTPALDSQTHELPRPAADGGASKQDGEVDVEMVRCAAAQADASFSPLDNLEDKAQLKRMGVMTAAAIALHNFPEGLATFLATVTDPNIGIALGVAIAIHNIPEGVCVAMPIYYSTGSKWKGFLWSLFSGITEPIGGIIGFAVLQSVFTELVFGVVFAMVGGMMVFIVLHELLPTAHRYMPDRPGYVTFFLVVGMVVMAISLVLFAI